MNKNLKEKILAILTYASLFLPIISINSHHDCKYDDCFRIFFNGRLGICVENAIDSLFGTMAVLWWFIIIGGSLVLSKNVHSLTPFVGIGLFIALAVLGALLDPAKWRFVIVLLLSAGLFAALVIFDSKNQQSPKRQNFK